MASILMSTTGSNPYVLLFNSSGLIKNHLDDNYVTYTSTGHDAGIYSIVPTDSYFNRLDISQTYQLDVSGARGNYFYGLYNNVTGVTTDVPVDDSLILFGYDDVTDSITIPGLDIILSTDTLVAISGDVTQVLADTNELQTDWVNGGRLDNLLDGAASAGDPWTTTLPGAYTATQAGGIIGNNINSPISGVDDILKLLTLATIEGKTLAWHIAKQTELLRGATAGNDSDILTGQTETIRNIANTADSMQIATDASSNRLQIVDIAGSDPDVVVP